MALSQIYTAVSGAVITAARWNNEFGNIYGNGTDVAFPLTKAISFNGFTMTYDAVGVTTIGSSSSQGFILTPGSKSGTPGTNGNLLTLAAGTFQDTNTAVLGTAAQYNAMTIRTPVLSASNITVTTSAAASLFIESGPSASTNQTITASYALRLGGMLGTAKGTDVTSGAVLPLPPNGNMSDVTGTTTVTSIPATQAGTLLYYRFTGAGLNVTYNATSMITQWGVTYRTIPNEILCFLSLGSGNYTCWTLNGPKDPPGATLTFNGTALLAGYLEEDGAAVSRTTYAGLFSKISTQHGVGDGSTTFNVPLSYGLAEINLDVGNTVITAASLNGGNAVTVGGKGGAQTVVLAAADMPAHDHPASLFSATLGGASQVSTYGVSNTLSATPLTSHVASQGGNGAHSNTQPWIVKKKCIRF